MATITTKFLVAQTFGFLGIVINVLSMHFKTRKNILTMLFLLNLCSALNFFFLDCISSSLIELFGCLQIALNSCYEKKKGNIPTFLVIIYVITIGFLGMVAFRSPADLLIIFGATLYCFTLLMTNEQNIRKTWLGVMLLYLVYDLFVGAYVFAISNLITIFSTLVAVIRYDAAHFKRTLSVFSDKLD